MTRHDRIISGIDVVEDNLTLKADCQEVKTLIEQAKAANTYICGADGKLCGLARTNTPFPCKQCKRNAAILDEISK